MVLFKRKNVEIPLPTHTPEDPDFPVWVIPETLEYFVTYDDYLARLHFYEAKRFNCELSGTSCLSFFDARARERQETQGVLQKFPTALKKPVLESVQFSLNTRLDLLVDEIYNWLRDHFFVGELVTLKRGGVRLQAEILATPDDTSTSDGQYELQELLSREKFDAPASQLARSRSIVSKPALRAFVKHSANRDKWLGAPWIVRDEYIQQLGLSTEPPPVVAKLIQLHEEEEGMTDEQLHRHQQLQQQLLAEHGSELGYHGDRRKARTMTPVSRAGSATPISGRSSPVMGTFNGDSQSSNKGSVPPGDADADNHNGNSNHANLQYHGNDQSHSNSNSHADGQSSNFRNLNSWLGSNTGLVPNYTCHNRQIFRLLAKLDNTQDYPEDDLFALAKEAGGVPLDKFVEQRQQEHPWPVWHEDERLKDLSGTGKTGHLMEVWLFTQLYRDYLKLEPRLVLTFDKFLDGLRSPEMSPELVDLHLKILDQFVDKNSTTLAIVLPPKPQSKPAKRPYRRSKLPRKRAKADRNSDDDEDDEDDDDDDGSGEEEDGDDDEEDRDDEHKDDENDGDAPSGEDRDSSPDSSGEDESDMDVDEEDNSWPARIGRREYDNGLWHSIVADILTDVPYVKDWQPDTRAIVETLRPANEPHTPVSVSNAYIDMPLPLRLHALLMLVRLNYQSSKFRNFLDSLHDEQSKFRKRPFARDLRQLKEDLRNAEKVVSNMKARGEQGRVLDVKDSLNGKESKKIKKEKEKIFKEISQNNNNNGNNSAEIANADDSLSLDTVIARVNDLRKQIEVKTAESEQNTKEVARLDSQRIQLLGRDRFYNRYWYMDGNGVAPLSEDSESSDSYALGRLCVQGLSVEDLEDCLNSNQYAEEFVEYRKHIFDCVQQFKVDQARQVYEKAELQRQARRRAEYASAKSVTPLPSTSRMPQGKKHIKIASKPSKKSAHAAENSASTNAEAPAPEPNRDNDDNIANTKALGKQAIEPSESEETLVKRSSEIEARLRELMEANRTKEGITSDECDEFKELQEKAKIIAQSLEEVAETANGQDTKVINAKAKLEWTKIFKMEGNPSPSPRRRKKKNSRIRSELIPVIEADSSSQGSSLQDKHEESELSEKQKRLKQAQEEIQRKAEQAARLQAHFDAKVQASSASFAPYQPPEPVITYETPDNSFTSLKSTPPQSHSQPQSADTSNQSPLVRATTKPGPIPGTASVRAGIPNLKTRMSHLPEGHHQRVRLYLRQHQQLEEEQIREQREMEARHRVEHEQLSRMPYTSEYRRTGLRKKQQAEHDELILRQRKALELFEEQEPQGASLVEHGGALSNTASPTEVQTMTQSPDHEELSAGKYRRIVPASTPSAQVPVPPPATASSETFSPQQPVPAAVPATVPMPAPGPQMPAPTQPVPLHMPPASELAPPMPVPPTPGAQPYLTGPETPQTGYQSYSQDPNQGFQWVVQQTAYGPMMYAIPVAQYPPMISQPPMLPPQPICPPGMQPPPVYGMPPGNDRIYWQQMGAPPLPPPQLQPQFYQPNPYMPGAYMAPPPPPQFQPPYPPVSALPPAPPNSGTFDPARLRPSIFQPPGIPPTAPVPLQPAPVVQPVQPVEYSQPVAPAPPVQPAERTDPAEPIAAVDQRGEPEPTKRDDDSANDTENQSNTESEGIKEQTVESMESSAGPQTQPDQRNPEIVIDLTLDDTDEQAPEGTPDLEMGQTSASDPNANVAPANIKIEAAADAADAADSADTASPPEFNEKLIEPKVEVAPNFDHVRENETILTPLDLLDMFEEKNALLSTSQWRFYDTPEEFDQLMSYLTSIGGRERKLIAALRNAEAHLKSSMEKRMKALSL